MSAVSSISLKDSLANLGLNIASSACLGGMVARYFEPIFIQKGLLAGALIGAANSLVQEAAFSTEQVERDPFTQTVIIGATLAVLFFASGTTAAASLLNRIGLELPESLMLNIIFGSALIGQGLSSVEASKMVSDATKERDEATKKVDDANEKASEARKKFEEAMKEVDKTQKKLDDSIKLVEDTTIVVRDVITTSSKGQVHTKDIIKLVGRVKKLSIGIIGVSGCTILVCVWRLMNCTMQCEQ